MSRRHGKLRSSGISHCVVQQDIPIQLGYCPAVYINQTIISQTEAVKYPGLHFDCRINWKEHITRKRKQTDLKKKEINWLIGGRIPSIYRKQITHLQSGNQTDTELWNRTVWLRHQVQHSHHAEITNQNSRSHNKCAPLCNKSYAPHRLQHP